MSTLERAIEIAVKVHRGEKDKAGEAYILHPLRVMLRMDTAPEKIVAVLHDVLEDGKRKRWTAARLAMEGFRPKVLAALDRLTRREGEDYFAYVRRAGGNDLSRKVKIADLKDNMDIKRIPNPKPAYLNRLGRYRKAMRILRNPAN